MDDQRSAAAAGATRRTREDLALTMASQFAAAGAMQIPSAGVGGAQPRALQCCSELQPTACCADAWYESCQDPGSSAPVLVAGFWTFPSKLRRESRRRPLVMAQPGDAPRSLPSRRAGQHDAEPSQQPQCPYSDAVVCSFAPAWRSPALDNPIATALPGSRVSRSGDQKQRTLQPPAGLQQPEAPSVPAR